MRLCRHSGTHNNYSIEITSCTYTFLVLQFSQHFSNYKNRFEVLVSLAA